MSEPFAPAPGLPAVPSGIHANLLADKLELLAKGARPPVTRREWAFVADVIRSAYPSPAAPEEPPA